MLLCILYVTVSCLLLLFFLLLFFFFFCFVVFFFQAEDGIRDHCVTGVQTCALPIFPCAPSWRWRLGHACRRVARCSCRRTSSRTLQRTASGARRGRREREAARGEPPRRRARPGGMARRRPLRSEERRGGKEGRAAGW